MKIGVIGNGYVGSTIIKAIKDNTNYKLSIYDKYQKEYSDVKNIYDTDIIFLCTPTPMNDNGEMDSTNLIDALDLLKNNHIIVIKSTVIMGTTRQLSKMFKNHTFVHSPEFLKELTPYDDFINADRIVIGSEDLYSFDMLKTIYINMLNNRNKRFFKASWEEAELSKYISNSFLALKVSFSNEIKEICDKLNINWETVRDIWTADHRIGRSHTQVPGPDGFYGYGGKCFPKDINSFIKWAYNNNLEIDTLKSALKVNNRVRDYEDWKYIKGATSKNNYRN